jgi:hypothetical protein
MIAPAMDAGPTLWISPQAPGRDPANTDGTAAKISAARHVWEEDVQTYRTYTSVQQALKIQIISVFEPMYLDVLNDNMVVFSNISARDMLDHLFSTYSSITAVDLEINFEHMRRAWDPQQPVESLFKQIQDCADYYEAGGFLIGHPHKINVGYSKIFDTGYFMSACRWWNEKPLAEKLGHNSSPTLLPLTVSTSKCTASLPQQPGTTLPTPLSVKLKTKWLQPPLYH